MKFESRMSTIDFPFHSMESPGQEKLILMGGGPRPPRQALEQFSGWVHSAGKSLLVISWASAFPKEASRETMKNFKTHFKGEFEFSLCPPTDSDSRQHFLFQLSSAGGVFFTGGDQARIMRALEGSGTELKSGLERFYSEGKVVGGTSAGAAIMSTTIIEGMSPAHEPILGPGLGFLGALGSQPGSDGQLILDQHFIQRNRQFRLLQALRRTGISYGIGIDEDTALVVRNRKWGQIYGDHSVRTYLTYDGGLNFEETIYPAASDLASSSRPLCASE